MGGWFGYEGSEDALALVCQDRGSLVAGAMSYYLLFYDVVDDFVERRTAFRQVHLALATEARRRGELVLAGSFGEPVDGAVLLFRCSDSSVAERFAEDDPYVREGLVTAWRVRKWHEVLSGE